jgi:heterodisulfide reductase subunit C
VVCPAGINLKELWFRVREDLVQRGYPEPLVLSPFSFYRGLNRENISTQDYTQPLTDANRAVAGKFEQVMDPGMPISFEDRESVELNRLPAAGTFSYCFGCQTCTTVCPVVAEYENPVETLGLLPHQIMNCLGLGLVEMASGPRMLWDCVTCYQCQEHCPQNVEITDIFFELKNLAVKNSHKGVDEGSPDLEAA